MNIRAYYRAISFRSVTRFTLAALLIAAMAAASACGDDNPTSPTTPLPRAEYSATDVRVGTGTEATNGKRLSVNYTLWTYEPSGQNGKGTQLQTGPFTFVLGTGGVISGWDRGVPGMKVGGLRRLTLPPELAYGSTGNLPTIQPNQSLVFEIELLGVQ
jgi:FKBP-type peptidyl-prolyl cis-trans isomerase FkpA